MLQNNIKEEIFIHLYLLGGRAIKKKSPTMKISFFMLCK